MAKISLKRKALESMLLALRRAAMARIKIMPWEISWFPTFGCNLRCGYCNSIKGKLESPNPEKSIETIISLAPASISILGGEPYIIPSMVEYLERIRKALPNVFILMTTNGMVKTEPLVRSMSLVSSLCVSMDGLGDNTRKQREGADPDVILDNIKALAQERRRLRAEGITPDLVVNSVVTRRNARHLPEFYKIIYDIDPTILNFSQGMQPFDHPDSIGSDPQLANEYLREVAKLKSDMRILLAGKLADGELCSFETQEVKVEEVHHRFDENALHTCYQERFNAFLSPSGNIYTCRRYSGINGCRDRMRELFDKKRPIRALGSYGMRWFEFVLHPPTFKCRRFCGCPEWMNHIMEATCEKELPPEIFRIRGRLSPERVRESGDFIRKRVNPKFQDSFLMAKETCESDKDLVAAVPKCKY